MAVMCRPSLFCWTKQLSCPELLISPERLREKRLGIRRAATAKKPHICSHKGLLPSEETHTLNTHPRASLVCPGPSNWGLGLRSGTAGRILRLWGERSVR